jgi:hypothetical protein
VLGDHLALQGRERSKTPLASQGMTSSRAFTILEIAETVSGLTSAKKWENGQANGWEAGSAHRRFQSEFTETNQIIK